MNVFIFSNKEKHAQSLKCRHFTITETLLKVNIKSTKTAPVAM